MDLEHVSAGKSPYNPTKRQPKQVQQTLFPKRSLRPAYRVSNEQIERIIRQMSAKGLCGRQMVHAYLQRQLRHNCRPNTIRSSGATLRIFLASLSDAAVGIYLGSTQSISAPLLNMSRILASPQSL